MVLTVTYSNHGETSHPYTLGCPPEQNSGKKIVLFTSWVNCGTKWKIELKNFVPGGHHNTPVKACSSIFRLFGDFIDNFKGTSRVKYRNSSQSSKSLKEGCCSWSSPPQTLVLVGYDQEQGLGISMIVRNYDI